MGGSGAKESPSPLTLVLCLFAVQARSNLTLVSPKGASAVPKSEIFSSKSQVQPSIHPDANTLPATFVQETVKEQKLTQPTPSVAWRSVLLTRRNLRDTRLDRPQGL